MTEYAMGRSWEISEADSSEPPPDDEYTRIYMQGDYVRACMIFMDKLRERDQEIERLKKWNM